MRHSRAARPRDHDPAAGGRLPRPGPRSASCSAAGSATCCSTSRSTTSPIRWRPSRCGTAACRSTAALSASSRHHPVRASPRRQYSWRFATSSPAARRSASSSAASPISSTANSSAGATDVPWAMVFPEAGPQPRHPSQLYEALLEGLVLFATAALLAMKRPQAGDAARAAPPARSLVGYGCARIFGGIVSPARPLPGLHLGRAHHGARGCSSVPMVLAGLFLIVRAKPGELPMPEVRRRRRASLG